MALNPKVSFPFPYHINFAWLWIYIGLFLVLLTGSFVARLIDHIPQVNDEWSKLTKQPHCPSWRLLKSYEKTGVPLGYGSWWYALGIHPACHPLSHTRVISIFWISHQKRDMFYWFHSPAWRKIFKGELFAKIQLLDRGWNILFIVKCGHL